MHTMNRRGFVWGALTAGAWLMDAARFRAPVVRVGILRSALSTAESTRAERGIRFGIMEAGRAARLLGGDITVTQSTDAHAYVRVAPSAVAVPGALILDVFHGDCATTLRLDVPRDVNGDVVRWHGDLERFGAGQLNARFRAAHDAPMDDAAWAGWFAVKVLWEAAARVPDVTARSLRAYMLSERAAFDGHKGVPLRFTARGLLQQPLYRLRDGAAPEQIEMADLLPRGDACEA